MTAGSVPATALNMTAPDASGRGQRRKTSICRPTHFFPTPRSASADLVCSIRFDHGRNHPIQASIGIHALAGAALADRHADLLLLCRLSDAAQPELLVD